MQDVLDETNNPHWRKHITEHTTMISRWPWRTNSNSWIPARRILAGGFKHFSPSISKWLVGWLNFRKGLKPPTRIVLRQCIHNLALAHSGWCVDVKYAMSQCFPNGLALGVSIAAMECASKARINQHQACFMAILKQPHSLVVLKQPEWLANSVAKH